MAEINDSKINECLNQLTDFLRVAGKCQSDQVPHKVRLAHEELALLRGESAAWVTIRTLLVDSIDKKSNI